MIYMHLWLLKFVSNSRFLLSCLQIHESHDALFLWGAKMCLISYAVSSSETSTCQRSLAACAALLLSLFFFFFWSWHNSNLMSVQTWAPCQLVSGDKLGTELWSGGSWCLGIMCVKERMARRRLARDKWGREVAVSRKSWKGGVSTLRQEPEQDTEATWEIKVWWAASRGVKEWCGEKIIWGMRDEEGNLSHSSPVFWTYQLSEAGRCWMKWEKRNNTFSH